MRSTKAANKSPSNIFKDDEADDSNSTLNLYGNKTERLNLKNDLNDEDNPYGIIKEGDIKRN